MDGTPIMFAATANPENSRIFYEEVLGLQLLADQPFALVFDAGGLSLRLQKVDRVMEIPYTILGWEVDDIFLTADVLRSKGVNFERYEQLSQDDSGIWATPDGAKIAWFKDPDGNTLSITQPPNTESA